jgi:hypothetical protein
MSTKRLLPIFVLAIGGLVVVSCGGQREDRNRVGEAPSYGAQGRATQFTLSNPRQNVVSSGFPGRE